VGLRHKVAAALGAVVLLAAAVPALAASGGAAEQKVVYAKTPPAPRVQSQAEADAKTQGCMTCHTQTDSRTMHIAEGVVLGCVDCHGGDAKVQVPAGAKKGDPAYFEAQNKAHVLPRYPMAWNYPSSANPVRSYTLLNREAPEYIRFVNPADLRVAREACGACHENIIHRAERSMMATGAMLWGGAAYNNNILPFKNYLAGEGYTREGVNAALVSPGEIDQQKLARGVIPRMVPLPTWETMPPGDIVRVFERGGRNIITQFPEIGNPNSLGQLQRLEEPGRPDLRQSNRAEATGLRIAVPVINIHKTRLNDPFTWFLGTNDQPGDYRTSGCGSCHVVYANDRDPRHSGPYAKFGHDGTTQTVDPTIPRGQPGHPLKHSFTNAIPTSQCMICHMHQPNMFINTYLGYTMWDYEPDAKRMFPEKQAYPSNQQMREALDRNPEEAVLRGKWIDVEFTKRVADRNHDNQQTQFADYHGHGWNFRAIFKRDRKGNLLDQKGNKVSNDDPERFKKAIHMSSIHVDYGMHCVDCHFAQDSHGNGYLYGEVMNPIEIRCKDCHGTASAYPTLQTSGPAAPPGGNDLRLLRLSDGRKRFEWVGNKLIQRSALYPGLEWEMSLVKDTVDPNHPKYNEKAARAKLMSQGASMKWGPGIAPEQRAHKDENVECYSCHLSWTTSCGGCHLPIQANWKTDRHHFEGGETRNWASYNPQVARDEIFMLGRHSTVKNHTVAPLRSSSALILSSTNINRERIYIQQPPIAASGYSSQAINPHYPHTERKEETKTCSDCHVSADNDNNAIVAQTLGLGTNFINFVGYNAWVGGKGGFDAVRVTEWDEPQAVIGSYLHKYAYPDWYNDHQKLGRELKDSYTSGAGDIRCIQLRGEYVYAAQGADGFWAYDAASIANKGFSHRVIRAPVSPLGQRPGFSTKNATCVQLATTQPVHWDRNKSDFMRIVNQEQPMHEIYRYAFITDAEEGLILTDIGAMHDQLPSNNFLNRALTWNEGGVLTGARHLAIAGTYFYIPTPREIVVLDMDVPMKPRVAARIPLAGVRATAVQFRYLFTAGEGGLNVVDVTRPDQPRVVPGAAFPIKDARHVFVSRTFAYIAAGGEGLVIVDVERPEQPKLYMRYNADGKMNDANDVIVATTNASLFAYVADGKNGLKVIQLTSPDSQPNFYGFAPDPKPELIAWSKTEHEALSLSRPLERDRAVDETGHQVAVFGRLGSRPFNLREMRKLFLDPAGQLYTVKDPVQKQDFVPSPRLPRPGTNAALPPTTAAQPAENRSTQ
jgi:formate-dependent nitrite reductase cytochrome c552 subunit